MDRWHAPFVSGLAFLAYATGFIVLGAFGTRYAVPAAFTLGVAQSAWIGCSDYCVAHYFGLRSFGEISGLVGRMGAIGVMIGPVAFGVMRDVTGSYTVPYVIVALLSSGAAVCMTIVGRIPFSRFSTCDAGLEL